MLDKHKVFFYHVGNVEFSQIILSGGKRILFDYCHREKGEGEESPKIDQKSHLSQELNVANRDCFD